MVLMSLVIQVTSEELKLVIQARWQVLFTMILLFISSTTNGSKEENQGASQEEFFRTKRS